MVLISNLENKIGCRSEAAKCIRQQIKQINDVFLFCQVNSAVALKVGNRYNEVIMDLINYLSAEEWQTAEAGNLDGTKIINQLITICDY